MLYHNCHYKYNGILCEVMEVLPGTHSEEEKVRIRFRNSTEIICLSSELKEIPLTESILQSCYKSKTYVRDGNWDILWYLGGKNNVTIGEKAGRYYLLPSESVETVIEILPFEFVQGQHVSKKGEAEPIYILSELERIYPELTEKLRISRIRI